MEGLDFSLTFANTTEIDLQNYIYSAAFNPIDSSVASEVCRVGYAGLLLGAGGLGIYLALKENDVAEDGEELHSRKIPIPSWIFDECQEEEECSPSFVSNLLKSFNLGVLRPESYKLKLPISSHDVSLNSLEKSPVNYQFLNKPLFSNSDIKMRSASYKNSKYPSKTKMRTPRQVTLRNAKDILILERVVASNRLSCKFYKPGCDLRMEGDGAESDNNFEELGQGEGKNEELKAGECRDSDCRNPHCLDGECTNAWQIAEKVRRYIREASFDSLASDLSIEINLAFEEDQWLEESVIDPESMEDFSCLLSDENEKALEGLSSMKSINDSSLWTLTEIPTEGDTDSDSSNEPNVAPLSKYPWKMRIGDGADDTSSCAGSLLDTWEWDEDCYHEDDTLVDDDRKQFHKNSSHQSWLPDTFQELDLETELLASGKEYSPYTDRDSLSRISEASTGSEDITIKS